MAQLEKGMTREEFNRTVDESYKIVTSTGLTTTKKRMRDDLLERFANVSGISLAEAAKLMGISPVPTPSTPRVSGPTLEQRIEILEKVLELTEPDAMRIARRGAE